jgi:G3E family GTPase
MRINLLFGFLGSGKTTLARRILEERAGDKRMAVIVNEFGSVGIDGAILEGRNVDMVELTSGCLCCTLKGSLLNAVEELRETSGAEQIVIEATGVAQPEEMMETFSDPSLRTKLDMGPMVTVIDAPKYSRLRAMLGEFYTAQVENADVLVLNKIDLATAAELETVRQEVTGLNPAATVLFTEHCDLEVQSLLEGETSQAMARFAAEAAGSEGDAHDHHDHDHDHPDHRHAPAESCVLDAGGDAARGVLKRFFAELPDGVWRVKGFTRVDGAPVLVQYTMGQLDITAAEPRANHHLVFIGKDLDQTGIAARLAAVLGQNHAEPAGSMAR